MNDEEFKAIGDRIRELGSMTLHGPPPQKTFYALMTDAVALLSEVERLRADNEELHRLRERLAELLTGVANGLKGEPPELVMHDWSDLPELAAKTATDLATTTALLEQARRKES